MEAVGEWADSLVKVVRGEEAAAIRNIAEFQKLLTEAIQQRNRLKALVDTYEKSPFRTELAARLPREYQQIKKQPDVARVWILDGGLQVETRPIEAEWEGQRYALGAFVIRIGGTGAVTVWSEAPTHPDGLHHPHIGRSGVACFGNATALVAKLAGESRYSECFALVIRWLKTGYSPELAEARIEEWPVVPGVEVV